MKFRGVLVLASLSLGVHAWGAGPKGKPAASKAADKCHTVIEGTDQMQYQQDGKKLETLTVPAECEGKVFTVTLKHTGKLPKQAMGHNFVVSETKDMADIVAEAMKLGPTKNYLPDPKVAPFEGKVLAAGDKLLGGGESEDIKIDMKAFKKGGDYSFFCTFVGHSALMKGKFVVQ